MAGPVPLELVLSGRCSGEVGTLVICPSENIHPLMKTLGISASADDVHGETIL